MATIALEYNAGSQLAQKTLAYILSLGIFKPQVVQPKVAKTGLERAFEDIEKGRVHRLITPSKKIA